MENRRLLVCQMLLLMLFLLNVAAQVSEVMADVGRRDRCGGLHFFNPVPVMKLVEVVRCEFYGSPIQPNILFTPGLIRPATRHTRSWWLSAGTLVSSEYYYNHVMKVNTPWLAETQMMIMMMIMMICHEGKHPVTCRDTEGFIVNRLLGPYIGVSDVLFNLHLKVTICSYEIIDLVVAFSVTSYLKLADSDWYIVQLTQDCFLRKWKCSLIFWIEDP